MRLDWGVSSEFSVVFNMAIATIPCSFFALWILLHRKHNIRAEIRESKIKNQEVESMFSLFCFHVINDDTGYFVLNNEIRLGLPNIKSSTKNCSASIYTFYIHIFDDIRFRREPWAHGLTAWSKEHRSQQNVYLNAIEIEIPFWIFDENSDFNFNSMSTNPGCGIKHES